MNGPQSYAEAARLLDGLAEWTSKIDREHPLEYGELEEGLLTALVAFGHAMQGNTAAVVEANGLAEYAYVDQRGKFDSNAWGRALGDE